MNQKHSFEITHKATIERLTKQAEWSRQKSSLDSCFSTIGTLADNFKQSLSLELNKNKQELIESPEFNFYKNKTVHISPEEFKPDVMSIFNFKQGQAFIRKIQKTLGLKTISCRRSLLGEILNAFCRMKNKVCTASNKVILKILNGFGFEISETTLNKDLKFLEKIKILNRNTKFDFKKRIDTRKIQTNLVKTFISSTLEEEFNYISSLLKNNVYVRSSSKYTKQMSLQKRLEVKKEECVDFFIKVLKKTGTEAVRFFNYWEKLNWLDRKGKKIFNWGKLAESWVSFHNIQEDIKRKL